MGYFESRTLGFLMSSIFGFGIGSMTGCYFCRRHPYYRKYNMNKIEESKSTIPVV